MRLFYEENITKGLKELSPETTKHLSQVLRMKVDDQIMLTNGQGVKSIAEIRSITKRECTVELISTDLIENHNPMIHLAISFTKNNTRMEWLLEKITEVGIHGIHPIVSKRSERKEIKGERFRKKLIAAMLQSHQYHLPVLYEPISFDNIIIQQFDRKLIAHCEKEIQRDHLNDLKQSVKGSTLIVIGPEGDFTRDEIERALQQNFKSVSLGKNRLRTETAGLVAVTLLHHNA